MRNSYPFNAIISVLNNRFLRPGGQNSSFSSWGKFLFPWKACVLIAGLLLVSGFVQAATYWSIASAAWNTNSTWSTVGYSSSTNAGTFPKAGDIAYIGNSRTVTVSANATCAQIIIETTGVLNPLTTRTVSATTSININSNGTYTNQSTGAITTPSWTCNGTYNHATSSATLPKGSTTSTWGAASNLNITGSYTSATQFANFIGQTFGNFTFNPSQMTNTVCMYGDASGTVTVQGNFTISQTGTSTLYLRQVGYAYVGVLNINGNFSLAAGIFDLHNGGTTPTNSTVNLKGNFTLSGTSVMTQTTVQSGSTVNFNFTGTGTQTVSISPTATISSQATTLSCDIQFAVASVATIDMGTSVLKGTNSTSFTLNPGATIITANPDGLSTSGATGSIQVNGTRTYSTTANYTYNGTSAQVTGNAVTGANNLTISNTNASGVTFSRSISVTGNMNVTTGAHVNLGTFTSSTASLTLGGSAQASGTSYGGTTSAAAHILPTYFNTATGILNVSLSPPSNLSYNSPFSFPINVPITEQDPTVTGVVTSYGISPNLHTNTGLDFNTTTGAITGTPNTYSQTTDYTVTASNSAGSTTCHILLSVGNYRYAVANGNWNSNSTWAINSGGTAGASYPVSGDIVFIGEGANSWTVTIPTSTAAACGSLTMGNYSAATVATLNFANSGSSLAVGNDLVMNRPNAAATTAINLGTGSLTVGGTLKLAMSDLTPNSATNLINQVNISTGTVTTTNLLFNGQSAPQSQVVFSGAGKMNISGNLTFGYILGTLTPSTGTVNFNGTSAQTIPIGVSAVTYNNLTINNTSTSGATLSSLAISATNVTGNLSVGDVSASSTFDNGGYAIVLASAKTLTIADNSSKFYLSGTSTMATAPGGKTFGPSSLVNYTGSNQTVTAETYGHLTLSGSGTKTMPGSSLSVAGNFTMSGTATTTALAAINTAGNFTLGSGTTFNASTFTHLVGGNWTNSGTFTPSSSTIEFNSSGAGNIGASNFNNITFSGSGTKTATGALSIAGNVLISNNFTAGIYGHTVAGNWSNSGTFAPSGGIVIFNGTGAQTINSGGSSFFDLTIGNNGGTCTAVTNGITSTGTFTTNSGTILDMATNALSVNTVSHSGTLLTQYTSSSPITTGKTWGGLVNYNNASSAQTAMAGTYNNLTISTPGGATASGDIYVNGILNLAAADPTATPTPVKGCLEMITNYGNYPGTTLTDYNSLVSFTLYMGSSATTIGVGDVTGIVKRDYSIVANTPYTFGNQYTTVSITSGTMPTALTLTITIGAAPAGKPGALKRTYQIIPAGGSGNTVTANFHYLDSEIGSNTEANMVTWDYDIGGGYATPDEHGRANYDFTNNFIGLSNIPIDYFIYVDPGHKWRTIFELGDYGEDYYTWNGSVSTDWKTAANWTITLSGSGVPNKLSHVIIPNVTSTNNRSPLLPGGTTIINTISIQNGGILTMGSNTLKIQNTLSGGWEDLNLTGNNPGSSTVVFNRPGTSISGTAWFNNVEIAAIDDATDTIADITNEAGSTMIISGSITRTGLMTGKWYADNFNNTVVYNGTDQTILLPDGNNKYYNLTLSGSGTKTLPSTLVIDKDFTLAGSAAASGTTLSVGGNFTSSSSGSFSVGTVILNGTSPQTLGGTASTTFSNLTINNANGVTLGNNETVNGTLTLTSGMVNTDINTLTVGCTGSINNAGASRYIEGKLARVYCGIGSKDFPIGKGGNYRPMTLEYTALTGTSTVTAEEFESSAISGTLPACTSLLDPNRYWSVSETGGSSFYFDITLDGTGYTVTGNPIILQDGTNPLTSYTATVIGNNYKATHLNTFGNFEIASETLPQGSLSGSAICSGDIGQLTWTATAGTGPFTVVYNDGTDHTAENVSSGIPFNVYTSQTSTKVYSLTSVTSSSCTRSSGFTGGTGTVTVLTSATWNGSLSNDWNTPANWTPAYVPISCTDVTIPYTAITNFPTLSAAALCNNIILESGASLIDTKTDAGAYLSLGGTATVKRFIPNDWKWHFLSSPVASQPIWPEFAPTPELSSPTGWAPVNSGPYYFNWDFYYFNPACPIGGLSWVNLRYPKDASHIGTYNDRTYNDPSSSAGFGPLVPKFRVGKGYLVAYTTNWYPANNSPETHTFTGALNTGAINDTIIDYYGFGGSAYNLVGNPYPSSLDWKNGSGWDRSKLAENGTLQYDYWIWNDGIGNYGVFNSGGGDGSGTNNVTRYIAPEQAFFVRVISNGFVTINNNARIHNTQPWLKELEAEVNHIRLKLTTDKNSYSDEMIFGVLATYEEGGSDKFWSMYAEAPEIWSIKNGNSYSIDRMHSLDQNSTVTIGIKAGVDGNYTVTATGVDEFGSSSVLLEDLKTAATQELKSNPVYTFAATTSDAPERLRLHFGGPFGVASPPKVNDITVYSYGNTIIVRNNTENDMAGDVFVYNLVGQKILQRKMDGKTTKIDLNVPLGVYLVTVVTEKETVSRKVVIR
ncbi:MAG: T9SS type A sorting domain-containing protein [Bacteroidetes bacterium]|nr:T9SS type A sorting domain-containing protein [Bacteroidota bacterium]